MTQLKTSKSKRYLLPYIILTIILLVALSTVIPIPYYLETPGSADHLRDYVSVDQKRDRFKGELMMTTVSIRQATVANYLLQSFSDTTDLIAKKELIGASDYQEYEVVQDIDMKNSQNQAIQVALEKAKEPYELVNDGVYVLSILEESSFKGQLAVGDIIIKINQEPAKTAQQFIGLLKDKKAGDSVTIDYLAEQKEKEAQGKLIQLPKQDRAGIGISLIDKTVIETDKDIRFNTEDIGGPSAGLMFALELYGMLSNQDITKGYLVAGTGTINQAGEVGAIGGIDKKVIAATQAGADYFFAPDDSPSAEEKEKLSEWQSNYDVAQESAKKHHLDIKVIPIKTFDDALNFLNKLPEKA